MSPFCEGVTLLVGVTTDEEEEEKEAVEEMEEVRVGNWVVVDDCGGGGGRANTCCGATVDASLPADFKLSIFRFEMISMSLSCNSKKTDIGDLKFTS